MGSPIRINVKKKETTPMNMKINKEVFDGFKVYCGERGYPLNMMLEVFMVQYLNKKFKLNTREIIKWDGNADDVDVLSTPINKKIYDNFRNYCKDNNLVIKHVVTAFMEKFINGSYILEYVDTTKTKNKRK